MPQKTALKQKNKNNFGTCGRKTVTKTSTVREEKKEGKKNAKFKTNKERNKNALVLVWWLEDLNKIKKAVFNIFKEAITQETLNIAESVWIKLQNL